MAAPRLLTTAQLACQRQAQKELKMDNDLYIDFVPTEDVVRDMAPNARELESEIRQAMDYYAWNPKLSTVALLLCVIDDAVYSARPLATAAAMAKTIEAAVAERLASDKPGTSG